MAEQPVHPQDPDQLKNLLLVLEHARADAWLRRDRRALEALLTPDFIEINTFGRFTRDELLIRLFPRLTLHTYTVDGPELCPAGSGAFVLTYQCHMEVLVGSRKMKGMNHVAALYIWNGKQWRLALWQITPFCST
jgi:hypothetical protein